MKTLSGDLACEASKQGLGESPPVSLSPLIRNEQLQMLKTRVAVCDTAKTYRNVDQALLPRISALTGLRLEVGSKAGHIGAWMLYYPALSRVLGMVSPSSQGRGPSSSEPTRGFSRYIWFGLRLPNATLSLVKRVPDAACGLSRAANDW